MHRFTRTDFQVGTVHVRTGKGVPTVSVRSRVANSSQSIRSCDVVYSICCRLGVVVRCVILKSAYIMTFEDGRLWRRDCPKNSGQTFDLPMRDGLDAVVETNMCTVIVESHRLCVGAVPVPHQCRGYAALSQEPVQELSKGDMGHTRLAGVDVQQFKPSSIRRSCNASGSSLEVG